MVSKEKVFYFWGVMDIIGIVFYSMGPLRLLESWWDATGGNLGMIVFMVIAGGVNGILTGIFYLAYFLLPISMFFSAWFFFTNHRYAVRFALSQEALRVLTVSCSVTLFPVVIVGTGLSILPLNIVLFVFSELLKIGTLIFIIKKQPADPAEH